MQCQLEWAGLVNKICSLPACLTINHFLFHSTLTLLLKVKDYLKYMVDSWEAISV